MTKKSETYSPPSLWGGGATRTLEKECPSLEQSVLSHCLFHFHIIHPVQCHVSHQRFLLFFFSKSSMELNLRLESKLVTSILSGTLEIGVTEGAAAPPTDEGL